MTDAEKFTAPDPFEVINTDSLRLFFGQLISQSCDKLMSVGMIWVFTTHFSPHWIPWFIGLGAAPHLILASQSGHLVARFGALRTVIGADIFRGVLFLFCGYLVTIIKADSQLLALFLISAFVSNIAGALFNPAILSLPVEMLEPGSKRDKLTALIDSCFSLGNVIGPVISAIAYAACGLAGLLAINGLSYIASAVLALGIRLKVSAKISSVTADVASTAVLPKAKSVYEVLRNQPVITGMLFLFLLMNFFLAPVMIFMPWFAKNVYLDGIIGLAKLEAFFGTGSVVGGFLLSFVKLPGATWLRISVSLCLMAIAYLSFTCSHFLWQGCLSLLLLGFFLSLANVVILTLFQSAADVQDVPVVMGMVNLISVASLPISMGLIGSFIERVNVPTFSMICASIVIILAMSIRLIPGIQRV